MDFTSLAMAILTDQTCGEACWHAREDICRCSCGGKNHGCLRSEDGVQPARTSKIDGILYTLKAVGLNRELYDTARQINRSGGPKSTSKVSDTLTYTYYWDDHDIGAPARIKPATKSQIERWPELSAYREHNPGEIVYLLFVKA